MRGNEEKPYVQFDYNCDNGALAQIIIPRNATKDDLYALREMLEVLIARKFKKGGEGDGRMDSVETTKSESQCNL